MKKFVLFVVVNLLHIMSFAQIAYYDAIELSKKLSVNSQFDSSYTSYIGTLKKYVPENYVEKSNKEIVKYFHNNNPFFRGYFNLLIDSYDKKANLKMVDIKSLAPKDLQKHSDAIKEVDHIIGLAEGINEKAEKFDIDPVAGISVANIAEGLAMFMIERAKDELNVAFFERFKKFTEENDEIKLLFPITTQRLSNILSFHYSQMLTQLREAFYEDLNNLPDHVIKLLEEGENFKDLKQLPEAVIAINSIKFIRQIEYLSPPELIKQLPQVLSDIDLNKLDNDGRQNYENFKSSLELTVIFSESVTDTSDNRNWVSSSDFYNKVLKNEATTLIFLGLVYQQIKDKPIKINGTLVADHIKEQNDSLWYKDRVMEFIHLINKIDDTAKEINQAKKENIKVDNNQVYSYINTFLDVASFGNKFIEKYNSGKNAYNDYLEYARYANEIYKFTYQQQYSSAVMSSVELFKAILSNINKTADIPDNEFNIIDTAKFVTGYIKSNEFNILLKKEKRQICRVKRDVKREIRKEKRYYIKTERAKIPPTKSRAELRRFFIEKYNQEDVKKLIQDYAVVEQNELKWLEDLIKYGNFMAGLVHADTPEDAKNLIQSVALPSGSTTIKKNSNFNVSINGYLGASYRFDYESKAETAWNAQWAVSAPIGISLSTGFRKGGSLSLTGVLIDVGAIVDYQLSNDSTYINSEITLGNLFSPGGYIVYGMAWDLPISIGVGAQYGPGLTSIDSGNNAVINSPNWRFGAFISVDIPFFNIYNKPKRKF